MVANVLRSAIIIFITVTAASFTTFAQTEMEPWGNITGIRVKGQLMEFESSLRVVSADGTVQATALERQRPKYTRDGNKQIITTHIDSFYFAETVEENVQKSSTSVNVIFTAKKETDSARLFFCLRLPAAYTKGEITTLASQAQSSKTIFLFGQNKDVTLSAKKLLIKGNGQQLSLSFDTLTHITIKKEDSSYVLYLPLQQGSIQNGETGKIDLTIAATGTVDTRPVIFRLNTEDTGRTFTGFGGNFRLQNPKTDPQVIDYCLNNMRVAWGRVEMPFQFWQPNKDSHPIDSAKMGKLHPHVRESMEMAARLAKMNIPVILTAWSAPRWAITGDISRGPRPNGVWGNPLDTANMQAIYQSIADYIIYLRDVYDVEVKMFSFNESDLGINIRQTGEEHAQLIKGLGAYFQSRGLSTKMLLGDNSDATTYAFIDPAMKDEATHPYIGAISFHSWRGWDKEILQKWADAAAQMKLPLIIGEGSIDAAAWAYPAIFQEQTYAIKEINLYTRLMDICQPLTILQWQLTADYSPLIGGGIFGNTDSLHPGQRFWNLKQLASVPKDLSAMPIATDKPYISCAAQGNKARHAYAIHIVNNGATRQAAVTGFPPEVKGVKMQVTNAEWNRKESWVKVTGGLVNFTLNSESYITLVSE